MKKLFITLLFLYSAASSAQSVFGQMGFDDAYIMRNKIVDLKDGSIAGSRYIDEKFYKSEISGTEGYFLIRYNAYNDEMELKKTDGSDDIFALPKEEKHGTIKYALLETTYKLKEYTNSAGNAVKGYLLELYKKNNNSLLKREKVILIKEREGSGYEGYVPPKFSKGNTEYYLEIESKIVEFPKSKKELIKLFPEKKDSIEAFLKQNKIKFSNETDMKKIVEFLG